MNPARYSQNYWLEQYSYFDDGIYDPTEWSVLLQSRLLPKSYTETVNDYLLRLYYSHWDPESTVILDRLQDSVFQIEPARDMKSKRVEEWLNDIDSVGTNFNTYVRRSTRSAWIYGHSYTVAFLPSSLNGPANSFADQQSLIKPILRSFMAFEILNWHFLPNKYGTLQDVMFVSMDYDEDGNKVWKWYEITDTHYREYVRPQHGAGDPTIVKEAQHNLGYVPVITQYGKEMYTPMMGVSMIKDSAELDIAKFQVDSDIQYGRVISLHPQLIAYTNEQSFGNLQNAQEKYIQLRPESKEELKYLDPPVGSIEIQREIAEDYKKRIDHRLGADPISNDPTNQSVQISGRTRTLTYAMTEKRKLVGLADRVQEFETSLLQCIEKIIEGKEDSTIRVIYPDNFHIQQADALIPLYQDLKDTIKLPSWHKFMQAEVAKSTVPNFPELHEQLDEEAEELYEQLLEDQELAKDGLTSSKVKEAIDKLGLVPEEAFPDELVDKEDPNDIPDEQLGKIIDKMGLVGEEPDADQ